MLFDADINYLAVVLGGLAVQPLGALWYSKLFRDRWIELREMGDVDREASAFEIFAVPLIAALVIAYGMARLVDMVGADSVGDCIAVAAFVWVSFAATVQAIQINFSRNRSVELFAIEGGYQLCSFLIIGAIVGAFQ